MTSGFVSTGKGVVSPATESYSGDGGLEVESAFVRHFGSTAKPLLSADVVDALSGIAMVYQVLDDEGAPLDAHLDIEGREFVFHSRGGKRGQPGARNMDYGPALRLLLRRIAEAGATVTDVWLDSDEVLHLPRDQRSILDGEGLTGTPAEQFRIMSGRMQAFGRPADAPYGGSRVKKIRIGVGGGGDLADVLRVQTASRATRPRGRLPARMLEAITAEHIWSAVQHLTAETIIRLARRGTTT
jgi:5-methylcytosine-specific restriction protein A